MIRWPGLDLVLLIRFPRRTAPPHLPKKVFRRNDPCTSDSISSQKRAPTATLARGEGDQIVHETCPKDPITGRARKPETNTGQRLDRRGRCLVFEKCDAAVVEEVENADAGKGLGVEMGEHRTGGFGVHGTKSGDDEVEL